jgi:hypothetical protein
MKHIATYQEQIYNPSFFKELIDPKSSKYDIRYRQKLDILRKYNFISKPEYDSILKEAGLE